METDCSDAPEITSTHCGEDVLQCHLERALETADDDTTRYHLRQSLQLLNLSEPIVAD
ncbi:hypothetical protein [Natronomonas sp.]|uniref:hypothetical protein n=1 Tax=Natronomonas sp. TaxID=2184060 RepID=UPI002FC39A7F